MKKRVLITGGNKGIGLEVTRAFLALDYEVLINATKIFSKIFEGKIIINGVAPSPVSKRFATIQEGAKTIVWLATESLEYINGSCMDINDGSFPR